MVVPLVTTKMLPRCGFWEWDVLIILYQNVAAMRLLGMVVPLVTTKMLLQCGFWEWDVLIILYQNVAAMRLF
jgi:hypothetical protein